MRVPCRQGLEIDGDVDVVFVFGAISAENYHLSEIERDLEILILKHPFILCGVVVFGPGRAIVHGNPERYRGKEEEPEKCQHRLGRPRDGYL
ncbi:unnamed protein product [Ectocarpus sp. CCAP 1310/34]|nr:unnamed protein product [Ectocarpus sp. CCAP 1310/34]